MEGTEFILTSLLALGLGFLVGSIFAKIGISLEHRRWRLLMYHLSGLSIVAASTCFGRVLREFVASSTEHIDLGDWMLVIIAPMTMAAAITLGVLRFLGKERGAS